MISASRCSKQIESCGYIGPLAYEVNIDGQTKLAHVQSQMLNQYMMNPLMFMLLPHKMISQQMINCDGPGYG